MEPIVGIAKIGAKTHMEELLHRGHVYMNPASYFIDAEGTDRARRDPYECARHSTKATGGTLQVEHDGKYETLGELAGPLVGVSEELKRANIFCLYACRRHGDLALAKLEFGESAVIFLDFNVFIERFLKAAEDQGLAIQYDLVEYVDRHAYTGPMGPFRKFKEYESQSEFRIVALPGTGKPLSLFLGDLTDIALIVECAAHLRLEPKPLPRSA